jgi:hypothetical protein
MQRLFSKIERRDDGCWMWTGYRQNNGYGAIRIGGRTGRSVLAHRFVFEFFRYPIPAGFEIHHRCRNRGCVNPFHLQAVTHRDNLLKDDTLAARHAAAQFCPHWHKYDTANTIMSKTGSRKCRTCQKKWHSNWASRNRRKSKSVPVKKPLPF